VRFLQQACLPLRTWPGRFAGAACGDRAKQRAHFNGVAFVGNNLAQRSARRGRHFNRHLVGFQFDQRLVRLDRIARLLEPLPDGCLGDRFTQRRYADFVRH
jgi:hypothetical protein